MLFACCFRSRICGKNLKKKHVENPSKQEVLQLRVGFVVQVILRGVGPFAANSLIRTRSEYVDHFSFSRTMTAIHTIINTSMKPMNTTLLRKINGEHYLTFFGEKNEINGN